MKCCMQAGGFHTVIVDSNDSGDKHVNGEKEGEHEEEEVVEEEDEESEVYYDKAKSFFDNISCEATSKAHG